MKTSLKLFFAICSLVTGTTTQATPPTAPYDNFNTATTILPAKWFGGEYNAARANRENLRHIVVSATLSNRLRLFSRGYGSSGISLGTIYANNTLNFRNPDPITAIKASVWVSGATITGCPGNPDVELSHVRARLGGNFFNASANPIPGNSTNDVNAQIRVLRASNSTDPANVLKVQARVFLCQDADCFAGRSIGSAEMGTVLINQKVTLSLEWNRAGNSFIFRRDALAPVTLTYTLSDASAPGSNFKNLQAAYFVPNCTSATPPTAVIDAYFDDVYTDPPLPAAAPMSAAMEEIDLGNVIFYGDSSIDAAGP